jgi:hypothetical protein
MTVAVVVILTIFDSFHIKTSIKFTITSFNAHFVAAYEYFWSYLFEAIQVVILYFFIISIRILIAQIDLYEVAPEIYWIF